MPSSTITPTFTVDGLSFETEALAESYLSRRKDCAKLRQYLTALADLPEPLYEGVVDTRRVNCWVRSNVSCSDRSAVISGLAARMYVAATKGVDGPHAHLIRNITELLDELVFPEGDVAQENEEVA